MCKTIKQRVKFRAAPATLTPTPDGGTEPRR